MTKQEYAEKVAEKLGLTIINHTKNGVELTGVCDKSNASAVFYVDDFFDNGISVDNCVNAIKKGIEKYKAKKERAEHFASLVKDFDVIKDNIYIRLRLFNKSTAEDYDFNVSGESYGFDDLILVPTIETEEFGVIIKKDFVKMFWNDISPQEIVEIGLKNIQPVIEDMISHMARKSGIPTDIIRKYLGVNDEDDKEVKNILVITNESMEFGASSILCDSVKKELQEFYPNGYIVIPSSVHECITIPYNENLFIDELPNIIGLVNTEELSKIDILSDKPYIFK